MLEIRGIVIEISTDLPAAGLSIVVVAGVKGNIVHPAEPGEPKPHSRSFSKKFPEALDLTDENGRFAVSVEVPELGIAEEGEIVKIVSYSATVTVKEATGEVLLEETRVSAVPSISFALHAAAFGHPGTVDPPAPVVPPAGTIVVDLDSPIGRKWVELGGEGGRAGRPVSEVALLADLAGMQQRFEHGTIVAVDALGAVYLSAPLFAKWQAIGLESGYPTEDAVEAPDGTQAAHLERAVIVRRANGQSFAVRGLIYLRYHQAWNDISGPLGLPLADDIPTADGGRMCRFDGADIYLHKDGSAFAISGAIRERWQALGGLSGLGYPLQEESPILKDGSEIGRSSRFERGVICWSGGTGAWEVGDKTLSEWEAANGAAGPLGLPTLVKTFARHRRVTMFQGGAIFMPGPTPGEALVVDSVEFFLDSFNSKGADGFAGTAGAQDLYVKVDISASTGERIKKRYPRSGDMGKGSTVAEVLLRWNVLRADLVVVVKMEAWDADDGIFDGDDRLAIVDKTYSIDNQWGLFESAEHWQGNFMTTYAFRLGGLDLPGTFRERRFWRFHNFKTSELSWRQYASTFTDVANDESYIHFLDHAFYSWFYKSLAEKTGGNCFGMCLESIYSDVGRSLFVQPISRFGPNNITDPPDPGSSLANAINIKHGYQLGVPNVLQFIEQYFSGLHNAAEVFNDTRDQFDRGDYPLIGLAASTFSANGHVVRPYKWDHQRTPWRIWVANPNVPVLAGHDDADGCVIDIDVKDGGSQFTFNYNGEIWTGGIRQTHNPKIPNVAFGGRIFSMPFHVLSYQPATPIDAFVTGVLAMVMIFLGSTGETQQITDHAERTLFEPDLAKPAKMWSQLRRDPDQRIPDMMPVPLFLSLPPDTPHPQLFAMKGRLDQLRHEVLSVSGQEVSWGLHAATLSALVTFDGASGVRDALVIDNPGHRSPTLSLHAAVGGPTTRKASIALSGWPGVHKAPTRSFELGAADLMKVGHTIRASLSDGGRELVLHNLGPATRFDLRVNQGTGAGSTAVRPGVVLDGGKAARIRPVDWHADAIAAAPLRMDVLDHPHASPSRRINL